MPAHVAGTSRVMRNTYASLSMTLLFSAVIAAVRRAIARWSWLSDIFD